jgi:hypothetical protein
MRLPMSPARRLALGLALAGCFTATARAQTSPAPAESEETDGGTASDAPAPVVPTVPEATEPPPVASPAPAPRPTQTVDPEPTREPAFSAAVGPPSTDVWPIEYVLRPQTLPARTWRGALNAGLSLPDPNYRSAASGLGFHRSLGFGVGVTMGVTDRVETWFSLPRIVCLGGERSSCGATNRLNGTGLGVGWGLVRTRTFQLELSTDLSIALSSPTVPSAGAEATAKWLLGTRLALGLDAWVYKWLGAPSYIQSQSVGAGGASVTLNLQATGHLLVFAGASPNGPLDRLDDDPRLAVSGGVSWTFNNGLELAGSGVTYNVLRRRIWDQTVPGGAAGLALRCWL